MATYPLRDPLLLAHQIASLDVMSEGRALLVACSGITNTPLGRKEQETYGVTNRDKLERLTEWTEILRLLWTTDSVTYSGKQYALSDITLDPKPREACPIWFATNTKGDAAVIERAHTRIAKYADGWQTSLRDHDDLQWRISDVRSKVAATGKNPAEFPVSLYRNITISDTSENGLRDARSFLQTYYAPTTFTDEEVIAWTAYGPPEACVEQIKKWQDLGLDELSLRITSWDQRRQLDLLINEVIPGVVGAS